MNRSSILQALEDVQRRIAKAAHAACRVPESICLIAVSKHFSVNTIREAYAAGCQHFGENYAQEFKAKAMHLRDDDITWHFIGNLQSNKTRIVAEYAQWVHTIDRFSIAKRLSEQRADTLPHLNVCIQVNISAEPQKQGCPIANLLPLAKQITTLPNIRLRGLMCVPNQHLSCKALSEQFALLRHLHQQVSEAGIFVDVLSMGMSHDLEHAIAEGATHIRIGTAIFGQRPNQNKITITN
ncbi:MAG: YggS family pyridoxal phosphate-dependent enzyme [Neisseriales bacterium]|nr:MAG: YggS family pyridoxal phosphate-dependent enzyme [Neisseriales bacterium]